VERKSKQWVDAIANEYPKHTIVILIIDGGVEYDWEENELIDAIIPSFECHQSRIQIVRYSTWQEAFKDIVDLDMVQERENLEAKKRQITPFVQSSLATLDEKVPVREKKRALIQKRPLTRWQIVCRAASIVGIIVMIVCVCSGAFRFGFAGQMIGSNLTVTTVTTTPSEIPMDQRLQGNLFLLTLGVMALAHHFLI